MKKLVDFPRLTPSLTCIWGDTTHSFDLNDPHMQMSYIWARIMLNRAPGRDTHSKAAAIHVIRKIES